MHMTTIPFSFYFFKGQPEYMQQKGLDVHVLSSPGRLLWEFEQKEQVAAHAVPIYQKISPTRDLVSIFQVWQTMLKVQPTIVHAHSPKGGLVGMISALLAGVPLRIYHIRGLPLMTAKGHKRFLLWLSEKASCLLAHQVLCVSHSIREVAISENLCPASKVKVLLGGSGNGVDAMQRFNPRRIDHIQSQATRQYYGIPKDALVIGFIGRVVRDKGITELVEAWKILRAEFDNIHLLIVGPFEPKDPIPESTVATLKNDERIHLIGENWDTPLLYSVMQILVLPTYREGFPNVLLEASAMELPIVATQIPGCIDAVEAGVTGELVPVQDAIALSNQIRKYLSSAELRRRHGQAGREKVLQDFRQEAIWEAIYQEYKKLLHEKNLEYSEPVEVEQI